MGEEAVSHYIALLDGHAWLRESMSVTWAHGLGEEAVFRAFGADPATAQVMTGLEVESALMDTPRDRDWPKFLRVGRATEAWVFGVEAIGSQGSRPEVIRPLSRYGRALSVFWNVNATPLLSMMRSPVCRSAGTATSEPLVWPWPSESRGGG